jgi:hypothetical protein
MNNINPYEAFARVPDGSVRSRTARDRWGLAAIGLCWAFAASPIYSDGGGYAFVVWNTSIFLPHVDLISPNWPPYVVAEFGVRILSGIAPIVMFDGEGPQTVRPFFVVVCWSLAAIAGMILRSAKKTAARPFRGRTAARSETRPSSGSRG